MRRAPVAVAAIVLLAACNTVVRVQSPDPGTVPAGPLEAHGDEATGPIVELDSDIVGGIGWRYSIYPSGDNWCTQFETVEVTSAGCGSLLPEEGHAFGSVGRIGQAPEGLVPIEGVVSPDIATVFLIDGETQNRVPAKLLSLEEVGLDAQAFIGFQPSGMTVTHLQALRFSGEIVETYELP